MKLRTLIAICIMALFAIMSACEGVDRDLLPNQQRNIVSYLGSKPYVVVDGVYRHIPNAERDGYDDEPVAQWGDSVWFDYATYLFTSSPQTLAATNIFALIQGDTIINTQYWSFDPVGVKLGTTPLMNGLQRGLPGCHRGDSVVLLITSDLAYGDKTVGTIPQNSAMMISLKILTVK